MPFRRGSSVRRSYSKKRAWSVERTTLGGAWATVGPVPTAQNTESDGIVIVPASTVQGVRTIKHLTLSIAFDPNVSNDRFN